MQEELARARVRFEQMTDRGSSLEASFREFLRTFLPRRLEVGQGEVIDTYGQRSAQTDVVIVTEDHPPIFSMDQPGIFLVEGVAGAAEVKASLDRSGLETSLEAASRFSMLRPNLPRSSAVMWTSEVSEPFEVPPPWVLFAYESRITLDQVAARITAAELPSVRSPIDGVFVLDQGFVLNFSRPGGIRFGIPGESSVEGWHPVRSSAVLLHLLGWLSVMMPKHVLTGASILFEYVFGASLD